jgi:hypothetical protein
MLDARDLVNKCREITRERGCFDFSYNHNAAVRFAIRLAQRNSTSEVAPKQLGADPTVLVHHACGRSHLRRLSVHDYALGK